MDKIRVFDFSDPASLTVDVTTECFQPRFDNTVAMTAYQKQTLILTTEGQVVALKQPLRECLKSFCIQNGIYQYEMDAYYARVRCRTQGLIAGHNRLVPSQGTSNARVVYYMAHFLGNYCYSTERDRLLVSFEDFHLQIYIDASLKAFQRIVNAADRVSVLQLQNIQNKIALYGMWRTESNLIRASDTYCSRQDGLRLNQDVRLQMMLNAVRTSFINTFGEEPDTNFQHQLARCVNRRFRG